MSQQEQSGPSTEVVAIIMFFAGFALGVEAERTNIATSDAVAQQRGTQVATAPASATPHAMRGMTGLLQLGGAVTP